MRYIIALFFFTLLTTPPVVNAGKLQGKKATLITDKMKALQALYALPSLSLSLGQGTEIIYAQAIGYKNVELKQQATVNTLSVVLPNL